MVVLQDLRQWLADGHAMPNRIGIRNVFGDI